MKIVMLLGSPHKKGTTAALAESFRSGAESAGHSVEALHLPSLRIFPCTGCAVCRKADGDGLCVHEDDDMKLVRDAILAADLVVFVSPLYYFSFTSQLKTAIDRFFGFNEVLRSANKRAVLISAGADSDDWAMDSIALSFETVCRYLRWESVGKVLAYGCGSPSALDGTPYKSEAYKLGASL